jgi:transcriptional regulator with XRE-family HTH domain
MAGWRVPVHKAVKLIREANGWDKARVAADCGIGKSTWSYCESGSFEFSRRVLEAFREISGIDPYVLAYFLYYDASHLPEEVRAVHAKARDVWLKQLTAARKLRQRIPSQLR